MTTPDYVKGAVRRYLEEGNGLFLAEMFKNGIPLHSYPEAREIITNLLMGKANRKRQRPSLSSKAKDQHYYILILVAQLHGAGLGVYTGGGKSKPTACEIAAKT